MLDDPIMQVATELPFWSLLLLDAVYQHQRVQPAPG
jgi:hypothetical protein